jgi:hypothetical protein
LISESDITHIRSQLDNGIDGFFYCLSSKAGVNKQNLCIIIQGIDLDNQAVFAGDDFNRRVNVDGNIRIGNRSIITIVIVGSSASVQCDSYNQQDHDT